MRDMQGIRVSFETYLAVSGGSSYLLFPEVYGLIFFLFSYLCKLKACRDQSWDACSVPGRSFVAQPRDEFLSTQLSNY